MAHANEKEKVAELPLTPERIARVVEAESKTFKGHGKEVRK